MKDANGKEMTVRPFATGTQYLNWEFQNCGRCKKAATEEEFRRGEFRCDIEKELAYGAALDGTIGDEIAKRLKIQRGLYLWPCGELEAK